MSTACLTDGGFWWGPNGEEFKQFNFADVMGISLGRKAGLRFALISGEASPLVDRFAEKMGIVDVYKGCKDKAAALRAFAEKHDLSLQGDLLHGRRRQRPAGPGLGRHSRRAGQRPTSGPASRPTWSRERRAATAPSANWSTPFGTAPHAVP